VTNKEAILQHLVWIASPNADRPGDKAYAWKSAHEYAAMLDDWCDLPELLTTAMIAGKHLETPAKS
jgi:hypothetical protein